MTLSVDSEARKFIDVLLVVMGLILAGSSNQNELFYYTVFAFLTFAITTRAWITFKIDRNSDDEKFIYKAIYLLTSSAMAISFPLVFVSYFYTKLNIVGLDVGIVFASFAAITAVLSAFIFTSLTEEVLDLRRNWKEFIAFVLFVLFVDLFILGIYGISTHDGTGSPDYIIQNASILINNATVTITNTGI